MRFEEFIQALRSLLTRVEREASIESNTVVGINTATVNADNGGILVGDPAGTVANISFTGNVLRRAVDDYASVADYCDACLINSNTGERSTWDEGMCKLPVIKPGTASYDSEAMRAAASALPKAEKPNGVSDEDWKAAKRKAAKKIISAYNEMEETAPDAIYKAAGKTTPKRTVAYSQIVDQVQSQLAILNQAAMTPDGYGGTTIDWDNYWQGMDIYYDDDGSQFLLAQRASKLYRLPVQVDGEEITLAAPEEISLTGRSADASSFVIHRQEDGSIRWFATASAAVLNRVNSIDSTELFDNFIKRAKATGQYPQLTFYHHKDQINLGKADWLGRSEYLYLASGTAASTPDGIAAMQTLERAAKDTEWGCSIGYYPIGEPDMLEVARGVVVPVYTDGINDEISIVREVDAASYYTRMVSEGGLTMRKHEKQALVAMFGQQRADEMEAQIDSIDRSIVADDQIRREGDAPAATTEAAVTAAPTGEAIPVTPAAQPATITEAQVFEIPESMMTALADAVTAGLKGTLDALNATVATLTPRLEALEGNQRSLSEQTETRLATLEQDEQAKQRQWLADLPAAANQRQVLVIRPSERRGQQAQLATETAPSMADVANATVAKMSTRQPLQQ